MSYSEMVPVQSIRQ